MSLFKRESRWKKLSLFAGPMEAQDFNLLAWTLADRLWQHTKAPLYFARYADGATGKQHLEIKLELDWTEAQFREFFDDPAIVGIDVVAIDSGSLAHAQAYLLARELHGKGEQLTSDVLHWVFNMTGYSYIQEIKVSALHAAALASKLDEAGHI